MDNSGSLNAQVLHLVAERIRTKAVFQVGQEGGDPGAGLPGGLRHPRAVAGTVAGPTALPVPLQTHQAKFVTWQFDGEYRGDDCTATLTLGNPDLLGESGERGVPPAAAGPGGRALRALLSPQ